MSAIETELLKMTGLKSKKGEKRQAFLARLVSKAQEVADDDDAKWEELSEETQHWVNAATTAVKSEEEIEDYAESEEDDEAEDEADDSEEDSADEADDEEEDEDDEKSGEDEDNEDEEDEKVSTKKKAAPKKAPAKKAAPKKAAPAKDDKKKKAPAKAPEPAKKAGKEKTLKPKAEKKARTASAPKDTGIKFKIKKLLIKDSSMSVDDLVDRLSSKGEPAPSRMTISSIRADFRHSLHVMQSEGIIKGLI